MIKRVFFGGFMLLAVNAKAQFLFGPLPAPEKAIRQNSVSVIEVIGDTVWIGPKLNFNIAPSLDWPAAPADSVVKGRFSAFSLGLQPDTIVAGLGFYKKMAGASVATIGGFYTSKDGGDSWTFIAPPLDPQGTLFRVVGRDTLRGYYAFTYGNRQILALAVTVPEQSVPWDVTVKNGTIFSAMWASGVRRSLDFGQTWERLLLPPFEQPELTPQSTYNFIYQPTPPRSTDTENPNTRESWTNFLGFSVLVDSRNRVWVGTAGGLNVSDNAFFAPTNAITWKHAVAGAARNSLPANWIITIKERPADSTIWTTNWVGTNSGGTERFAISATRDGETFQRFLEGEKIYDIAFQGRFIYAAGDNGLFISSDEGSTWRQLRSITSANNRITEKAVFQGVAASDKTLWVATTEGLASSSDFGRTWSIIRTNFPLSGRNQFHEGKTVETYAYPNPFSVRQHGHTRFRFEAKIPGMVTIQLFDTGMNLVRELGPMQTSLPGEYEMLWDGTNRNGQLVPNGPLFYVVKKPGGNVRGKLLMLD